MKLPGESELGAAIRRDLAPELQITKEMLDLGIGIFQPIVRPKPAEEMDRFEVWMCLGIVAKACRQYRGIVALAELALGEVADSNGRMLAETLLAAEFLMRPTFELKRSNKLLPEIPGYPLTRAFRTKLYLAHDASSSLKTIREMVKHGEIDAVEGANAIKLAEEEAKSAADEIGPEWAARLKKGRSYSGVGVLDMAESINMPFLYHTFYRPSSAGVHATDARKFIEPEESRSGGISFCAISSEAGVAESIQFSSLVMLQILCVVNKRFGLGLDEKLCELGPRVQAMSRRLADD